MTDEEISLLRSLSEVELLTFLPEGTTPAALRRFDEVVAALRRMQKAGWIELELAPAQRVRAGRNRGKYRAAAAKCTEEGKRALEMPGGPAVSL
jgi:hypothetical protein